MLRLFALIGFLSLCIGLSAFRSSALALDDTPRSDLCQSQIEMALAREQRIYRDVLFGRGLADYAKIGEVRFDDEGNAWYKKSSDSWIFVGEAQPPASIISDSGMDSRGERDSLPASEGGIALLGRSGIFATPATLTSDLIPEITQSFRALQCRTAIVCELAQASTSVDQKSSKLVELQIPGCISVKAQTFEGCHLAAANKELEEQANIYEFCTTVGEEMIKREVAILKMVVEYDAAYRTILQFGGMFDKFLEEFRWTITSSLRQSAYIIGWLNRIPCFLGSCDEYIPPGGWNGEENADANAG